MIKGLTSSRLRKNVIFSTMSFVFISGINFLTIPIIINKMNLELFGIYTLLTSLFGYFGIFDFGLGQGLIKFVSEYYTTNQLKKASSAINSCLIFQILISFVLLVTLYSFSDQIVRLFNVSGQYYSITLKAFKISLLGLFISMISATFSSVLMGLQRYDLTSSVDSIGNFLLNITLVALLVFIHIDLSGIILLSVSFTIITMIIYIILIRKNVRFYSPRFEFDVTIVKLFIKYSINIFLSKLSALFSNHLVRFILSYFLTPSAVTLFVVPSKLLNAICGMLSSGANTLFPYISSLNTQKNMAVIKEAFLKATSMFAAISIPVLLFVALYSQQVLTLWMGAAFAEKTWLLLSIITISSLIGSFSAVPNLVILGMGNSRLIAFFSVISIILYLIFLPLLTAKYNLIGCAIALLIASSVTILFVFRYTLRYIQVNILSYFKATYLKHFLPTALFILSTLLLKLWVPVHGVYYLIIGSLFVLLYYYFLYQNVYLQFHKENKR